MTTDILLREDTGSFAPVRMIDPDQPVSAPYSRAVGHLDRWVRDERRAVDEFAAWIDGRTAQAAAEMRALCDELELPPAPIAWAEEPPYDNGGWLHSGMTLVQPVPLNPAESEPLSLALRGRYGTIGEPSPYDPNPPAGRPVRYDKDGVQAYYDADDSDDMPGRVAHAWVNLAEDDLMPVRAVRVGRTTLTPRDNPLAQAYAEREARGWTPDPANYESVPVQGPRGGFWRRIDAVLERWDDWLRRKQAERDKRMGAAE